MNNGEDATLTPAQKLAASKAAKREKKQPSRKRGRIALACGVAALRKTLGLSNGEVAESVGVSAQTLYVMEHGGEIRLTIALKVAAFYGKTIEELWREKEGSP